MKCYQCGKRIHWTITQQVNGKTSLYLNALSANTHNVQYSTLVVIKRTIEQVPYLTTCIQVIATHLAIWSSSTNTPPQTVTSYGRQASEITGNSIVCSTICLSQHRRKHENLCHWSFMRGIHRRIPPTKGQYRVEPYHVMTSLYTNKLQWLH